MNYVSAADHSAGRVMIEVPPDRMGSNVHALIVRNGVDGQMWVELYRELDLVRTLTTFRPVAIMAIVDRLRLARDPETYCRRIERPWNCMWGGPIRLDAKLGGSRRGKGRPPMTRESAEAAYRDTEGLERSCLLCAGAYRGRSVYCSLTCAEADE